MNKFWKFLSYVFIATGLIVFVPICLAMAFVMLAAGLIVMIACIAMIPGFLLFVISQSKETIKEISDTLLNEFPWWA